MPNDHKLSKNIETSESLWEGLFSDRTSVLLLGGGLFFLLVNVVLFFGMGTRPTDWLFYLDMRYWPVYVSIAMWIVTLWIISESTDMAEDYVPYIRVAAVIGILLTIIFALQSSPGISSPVAGRNPLWSNIFLVVAIFCIIRSLLILYDYQYGEETTELDEEVKWFLGLSGFLFVGFVIYGLMWIIPVEIQRGDSTTTSSLFAECRYGIQTLIRNGSGSFVLRMFAFLLVTASIAFVCAVGKWLLIVWLKMRGE
jgi:hypothetical protein